MQVEFGKNSDIDEWMKLVEEISWNFPGLETKENMEVYCSGDRNERVVIMFF